MTPINLKCYCTHTKCVSESCFKIPIIGLYYQQYDIKLKQYGSYIAVSFILFNFS